MEIKIGQPTDVTARVNDTVYKLQNSNDDSDYLFDDKETANRFKITTDFLIKAEAVKIDRVLSIRYNYQVAIVKCKRLIINLN